MQEIEMPTAVPAAGYPPSSVNILSEIHIHNSNRMKWPVLDHGGFSTIFKKEVEFEFVETSY